LQLNIVPVDENGSPDLDWYPEDPKELIDQRLDFVVNIFKAVDLPQDLCRDVYVEYSFYLDQTKYRTDVMKGQDRNPEFKYAKHHTVNIVTKMLLDYLEKELMVFRVYAQANV